MTAPPARLIVILGPTASGKSALAIELAKRLNGEILVCDSTQVYRHFDIGTAKVSPRDQGGIPHHLVDLVEPNEIFTAGDYRRHALLALDDLRRRSKLPILAAGTGLYLRALLEGLADAPTRSEELRDRLRRSAKQHGAMHLHKILARLDPASAARIAPRDIQKIIRAIEMRVLAGKPVAEIFSASRAQSREDLREHVAERETPSDGVRDEARRALRANALEGYAITKIGLAPPRPALYARIDARVNEMLAAGWLDEVRALVSSGVRDTARDKLRDRARENVRIAPDSKPFQFIGYSELRAHLEGRLPLAAAVENIQQSTRRFAKRQLTWFRREPDVHWLAAFGDADETIAAALDLIAARSSP